MSIDALLEWSATLLGLLFIYGLIKRKVWAWPFGTLSSAAHVHKEPKELVRAYLVAGVKQLVRTYSKRQSIDI